MRATFAYTSARILLLIISMILLYLAGGGWVIASGRQGLA